MSVASLAVTLGVAGCSVPGVDGPVSSGVGSVKVSFAAARGVQAVASDVQSYRVKLIKPERTRQFVVSKSTQGYMISDIPAGPYTLEVQAFSQPNAGGALISRPQAPVPVEVLAGSVAYANVQVDLIDHVGQGGSVDLSIGVNDGSGVEPEPFIRDKEGGAVRWVDPGTLPDWSHDPLVEVLQINLNDWRVQTPSSWAGELVMLEFVNTAGDVVHTSSGTLDVSGAFNANFATQWLGGMGYKVSAKLAGRKRYNVYQ